MTALAPFDIDAAGQPQFTAPVPIQPAALCSALPAAVTAHPLPAFLFSARGKLPITVMNFAEDGAIAKGAKQPPCDSYALLVRNGVKVPAIVSWIEDGRFRLDFEEPLADPRKQAAFRGIGRVAADLH